jgi:hypothetical protein
MPVASDLLRELRPSEDALPHDPADPTAVRMLERILADDPPAPAPRTFWRPTRRRVLAGGLVAVAVAVAIVMLPVGGNSSDVLARAATVLNEGDVILHVKAVLRGAGADGVDLTEESWQTTDGRQVHTLYSDGSELFVNWDTRTKLSYSAEGDSVTRHSDPDLFPVDGPKGAATPTGLGNDALGDLQRLLQRARGGEGSVKLLDDTEIDGRSVHQIEISYPTRLLMSSDGPARTVTFSRVVFIDSDTFLPVRVVDHTPPASSQVTDFLEAERLPRTPENETKLRFAPHPGAKAVVRHDDF